MSVQLMAACCCLTGGGGEECEECDPLDMPSSVTVSGTFTGCIDCIPETGEPEWDGVLILNPFESVCGFVMDEPFNDGATIGGVFVSWSQVGLGWNPVTCKWTFIIACQDLDSGTNPLWVGEMVGGPTDPTGTYTRTGGCDMTATRTVS